MVFAVLAVSSAAVLTGLTLAFAANAGSAAAIAVTHGANLAVTINASKVTAGQLAATRQLPRGDPDRPGRIRKPRSPSRQARTRRAGAAACPRRG